MRKMRKVLSSVATAALVAITAIPVTPVAAAPSPLAAFDFENGTGMSSSGIAGATAPKVVNDAERGNVLKFAQGESSKIMQKAQDSKMGDYDLRIDKGTPSSLKFSNPFKGKASLPGITIAMWVKSPSSDAAVNAAGLVGFVSDDKTIEHPDKKDGGEAKKDLEDAHGPFMYGVSMAYTDAITDKTDPMVYFAGLHHNSYNLNDDSKVFKDAGVWKFMVITQNNSEAKVYIDGKDIEGDDSEGKNKRWNDGEKNKGSKGNVGQPKFMDMISWADTQAYVGYTGFSPTYEGVCIDDLAFYGSVLSAAEVSALYTSAKAGEKPQTGNNTNTQGLDDAKEAQRIAEEQRLAQELEAQEANKNITNAVIASLDFQGMSSTATKNVTGIFRGEAAYTELLSKINGVTLRSGYRTSNIVGMDINFGGVQPEALATIKMNVPDGFDTSKMELARINDDGSVSILKYTIENGKIVTKTNHFSAFAIVQLEEGVYSGKSSSNLPKTGVVSTGVVVALGALSAAGGTVILKKRKNEEV